MKLYVFDGSPEEIRETVRSVLPLTADHAVSVELSRDRSPTVRSREFGATKEIRHCGIRIPRVSAPAFTFYTGQSRTGGTQ